MPNLTTPKPPDLCKVRLPLVRTLDLLPAAGPDWHPTFKAPQRVREHVKQAKREVDTYLGSDD